MRPLALSGLRIARSCSPGKRSAPGDGRSVPRIRGRARMRPLALSGLRIARSCSPGKRSAPGGTGAVSRGYVVGPGCGLWPYPGYALRGHVARVSEAHPGNGAQCPAGTWLAPDAAFGLPATRSELAHAEAAALDPAGFQPLQRPAHLRVGDGHVGAGRADHDLADGRAGQAGLAGQGAEDVAGAQLVGLAAVDAQG